MTPHRISQLRQLVCAILIGIFADAGQAFTPATQLEITKAVETNIVKIGRDNVSRAEEILKKMPAVQ